MPGRELPLLARDGSVRAVTLVDDERFDELSAWTWRLWGRYAGRGESRDGVKVVIYLHRYLLGLEPGDPRETDHENRNKLDNHLSNLRIVTHAQNMQNLPPNPRNRSGVRNVSWRDGRWEADLQVNGQRYKLGRFHRKEDAAAAVAHFRKEMAHG